MFYNCVQQILFCANKERQNVIDYSDTVKLSSNTILKSKSNVKWLEIYMNRKLNFKKHV